MYDKAFVDPGVRIKRSQVFLMFGCILVIFPHNAKKRLIIFKNVLQLFIPGCLLCSKNASFVMHVGRMRMWIQGSSYSKLIKNRSRSQSQSQPANTSVFSSHFAAGDVSRGGTSATQRQKFHTDDVKSVRNPVRSADWSADQLHCFSYCLRMTDKRQNATKVKSKHIC